MKVYYGDNQFLGVNHTHGKGAEYLDHYSNVENIAATLRNAWEIGIRDFCFTVSPKTIDAINLVAKECPFNLHPSLPYAQKVNEMITQLGLPRALYSKMGERGIWFMAWAGMKSLFGDYKPAMRLLIQSELEGIDASRIKSIGLLNVAADFALGLNRQDLLYCFFDVVTDQFKVKPWFYTMNFPLLAAALWGKGFINCSIVFNYNRSGFRTNPNLAKVEETLAHYKDRESIAMSIFSGGEPDDVGDFLRSSRGLSGVLFGSSSMVNMSKNYALLSGVE